jgi:hypothetical protein
MNRRSLAFGCCIALCMTVGVAHAGPCTQNDAGSGPTVGATAQTSATGTATQQHPPTAAMNSATQGKATSSEDAQRQEQGQPTAAQQAMGTSSKSSKMDPDAQQGQPPAAQAQEAMGSTSESAKMDQGC